VNGVQGQRCRCAPGDVIIYVDIAEGGEFTPTPVVSHAILIYNRGRSAGLADGIVITPSHNPPEDGGFKYNPPSGGPADKDVTAWIEARANALLKGGLITARMDRDPGEIYRELAREFGESAYDRVDAPATPEQKQMLAQLSPQQVLSKDLAGEKILSILTRAPGNGAAIGGVKEWP